MRTNFVRLSVVAVFASLLALVGANAQPDPLPSWNDGPAKQAILNFVSVTTDSSNPKYVAPERRIAAFDQDGTLWIEHPIYSQVVFALDRVAELAPQHPAWKTTAPFKYVLARDKTAMAKFTDKDLETIFLATHTGMSVEAFHAAVRAWIARATDPRWHRHFTDLIYEPMLEVMRYLRANGYRTYIVTGGGQEFVRVYADRVYGVPPEEVIGSAGVTQFVYSKNGRSVLMKSPKLLLNNNLSGKPEDVYLFTGRRPLAAFGNSEGDRQMLEYTQGSGGGALMMLVLHDDATREYAYGPADGLPNTKVGTFPQSLYDEARANGWTVVSMRRDWNRIFPG